MSQFEYPREVKTLIEMYDHDWDNGYVGRPEKLGTQLSLNEAIEKLLDAGFIDANKYEGERLEDAMHLQGQNFFYLSQDPYEKREVLTVDVWIPKRQRICNECNGSGWDESKKEWVPGYYTEHPHIEEDEFWEDYDVLHDVEKLIEAIDYDDQPTNYVKKTQPKSKKNRKKRR